ncbi:recombinase family protein [Paenibacillus alvei]|uniref:recombinase family protein n=1 Tax=Paenibacillus alvei TaxID=44250 RepID=UPI000287F3F4|nr:recombinase family protein [Paenibacillus alvei]EJW14882.1 putative site-specific integrase/resolvase [Paenibacillus alvei DSM 29]MCY9545066.1 recombinase family protein [Paenibacillus alvei]MCY9708401.1 recombinase family protein [Paenibacillus alvei]MCY9732273.1 recombinase family protein [Paenibacillus alvei]MCY9753868.1 recombinase family protein [Paenibacillus alvei]
METKSAIVYCRTATTEQDINVQLELCKEYAEKHGYKLELIFKDHGLSANDERPELEKMKEYIKENPGKTLIVNSCDRLHRDSISMHEFIQFAKGANYNVVSAGEDKSLSESEFILGVMSALNGFVKERGASE